MLKKISNYRDLWKFFVEIFTWTLITFVAFLLRFDGELGTFWEIFFKVSIILSPLKILAVYYFGTFRQSWRNTGFRDLINLVKSIATVFVIYFVTVFILREEIELPLSIPIIEFLLSLLILSGIRVGTRFVMVYWNPRKQKPTLNNRILIAGAGESGNMAVREMLRHPEAGMQPVAFLDDDKSKQGQSFLGLPVLGDINDMNDIVKRYQIDEVLIAMPSESGKVIRRVVDYASKSRVNYRIIPSIYDLISGKVTINQIRNVDVEDLLRRKPVQLDTSQIESYIKDKIVLVTGAGGSIGSEIVVQLSRYKPKKVILLGRGENSIHNLINKLYYKVQNLNYSVRIGDVRDYRSMERLFIEDNPDVIFHAAAHKHVPLMESNPEQAVLNNVEGTRNLVNLSVKYDVKHFVNISTDKAVNPTSVMGATKRISEQIVQWGATQVDDDQVYVSVRFGNVLGSRGSVIPKFKEQIKRGGPVTITHPDMVRYFMTIPEASQLVLQAGGMNMNGSVFVLDMGDPVSIEKMARDLIKLSGFEPDQDIKIEYTGIRAGEKLFEELLTAEEGTDMTHHKKIYVAKSIDMIDDLSERLDELMNTVAEAEGHQIKLAIKSIVPSYSYKNKEVVNF
ncbi:MAG: nucleoside-diphosphate sugar epimerase/dehydratase [Candidatus Paceibacterota bacterium]